MNTIIKTNIVLILSLFVTSSCSPPTTDTKMREVTQQIPVVEEPVFPMNYIRNADSLKNRVMLFGDINAYNQLCTWALDENKKKFLPITKIMADKYKYPNAYLHVYETYYEIYPYGYLRKSKKIQKEMLFYLKKALKKKVITHTQYDDRILENKKK